MDAPRDGVVFDVFEAGEPVGPLGLLPGLLDHGVAGAVHVDGCAGRTAPRCRAAVERISVIRRRHSRLGTSSAASSPIIHDLLGQLGHVELSEERAVQLAFA